MDIVVKGRHGIDVPDHFRQHVAEKLGRIERLDNRVIRLSVEISHERNPRQSENCQRVEITCLTKGPVVRAESSANDFYAALDLALSKLEARLRKAADRRRVHHGQRTPERLATAPHDDELLSGPLVEAVAANNGSRPNRATSATAEEAIPPGHTVLEGGLVVRQKTHRADPMTLDQALLEMELVGHDFFLFQDAQAGLPSVVYRRRGYDYGVIRLGD